MMRPPIGFWLFISLMASCVHRKGPVRLVDTTFIHCSWVRSSIGIGGAPVPALLNSTSRRPKTFLAAAKSAFTDAGSVTSVATASARLPPLPSLIAASSASLRRPAKTTE